MEEEQKTKKQKTDIYDEFQDGEDEYGKKIQLDELWKDKESEWYQKGVKYWDNTASTMDGIMGGFPELDNDDVSRIDFIQDCGAGIGRITKHLLVHLFDKVDIVEPSKHLIEEAKKFVSNEKLDKLYQCGLQEFEPEHKYDLIWVQWCSSHLTDEDFIEFLKNCKKMLSPGGYVCFKENQAPLCFIFDRQDSSLTRNEKHFKYLFEKGGFSVIKEKMQEKFPKNLFKVKMFALQ